MSNSFCSPSPCSSSTDVSSATVLLTIFHGGERQFHGDCRSTVGAVVRGHGAAELANHIDHQKDPEAGAGTALGRLIRLAEILQHVGGKAGAEIRHFDSQHVTASLG